MKTRLSVASCSFLQHIIRLIYLQTKRVCHIYTQHTNVHNFIMKEYDGILKHIIRLIYLQTKRVCHIYTQHTNVHNFIMKEYDGILNTKNVLVPSSMVQNLWCMSLKSDIHHKFPLISFNVQITYTNTTFEGKF